MTTDSTSLDSSEAFKAPNVVIDITTESSVGPANSLEAAGSSSSSKKELNRIYRKLDWRIIPALWVLYFLTSFGGSAYGNALTMNFEKGHSIPQYLHLGHTDLSTASAMDYVGYIVFDLPMNLIMTVVSPHTWMARIVTTVGVTYSCYAGVSSAAGIIVIRTFTGIVTAGVWPGMAYLISMWYPAHRTAQRIGYYFTAAQLSAATAGLVAAGFQKMDGTRGYTGYQWLFIVYGVVTTAVGLSLLWWLPDRPYSLRVKSKTSLGRLFDRITPKTSYPLNEHEDALHDVDMTERYSKPTMWSWRDLLKVILDPRLYPLVIMYFGVVGVGIGIMVFATTIIKSINPHLSGIQLSLLTAPIWLFDLGAIVIVTPIADRYKSYRGVIFSLSTLIIVVGMFVTTYAPGSWSRYGGLLICGFGLGPTVPITMAWAASTFSERHGDVGAAASTALVSGLGNLGSVTTTYALYTGWPADVQRHFKYSNMVMVAILGASILASAVFTLLRWSLGDFGNSGLLENTFVGMLLGKRRASY